MKITNIFIFMNFLMLLLMTSATRPLEEWISHVKTDYRKEATKEVCHEFKNYYIYAIRQRQYDRFDGCVEGMKEFMSDTEDGKKLFKLNREKIEARCDGAAEYWVKETYPKTVMDKLHDFFECWSVD